LRDGRLRRDDGLHPRQQGARAGRRGLGAARRRAGSRWRCLWACPPGRSACGCGLWRPPCLSLFFRLSLSSHLLQPPLLPNLVHPLAQAHVVLVVARFVTHILHTHTATITYFMSPVSDDSTTYRRPGGAAAHASKSQSRSIRAYLHWELPASCLATPAERACASPRRVRCPGPTARACVNNTDQAHMHASSAPGAMVCSGAAGRARGGHNCFFCVRCGEPPTPPRNRGGSMRRCSQLAACACYCCAPLRAAAARRRRVPLSPLLPPVLQRCPPPHHHPVTNPSPLGPPRLPPALRRRRPVRKEHAHVDNAGRLVGKVGGLSGCTAQNRGRTEFPCSPPLCPVNCFYPNTHPARTM
jgi:hypothetical protein